MVSRRFPPDVRSGSETVFEALYERAKRRHDVRLVAGFVRDRSLLPSEALGVDLRDRRFGLSHLALQRAARSAVRSGKPDVVLANSIEVPRTGAPTVCIVHDLNFGRSGRDWKTGLRERYYARSAKRLDGIIAPSQATQADLERIGVDARRITVIPSGVDLDRFRPAPRPVDEDRLQLVYPGRILPGKGQHVAIDAVARLHHRQKARVHLSIVGAVADPIYFDQLRIHAFNQPVSFHPDVPDIVPFYQLADLVLFPTLLKEGFGFTAVEAMACGKPVAWSEQPAIRWATGGLGWPVPMDDPVALREVIRAYLDDPAPFREAGARGRAFVQERYGWDTIWSQYEAVLRDLIH